MSVEFTCHECGRELKVSEHSIGRRVRCPECTTLLIIPDPSAGLEELMEAPAAEDAPEDEEDVVELEPIESVEPVVEPPPLTRPKGRGTLREPQPPPPPPPQTGPDSRGTLREPQPPPRVADEAPLLPPHPPHPEDLIDMTAMVDIVFFLLIFFLVTSLQALESVMDMPTPQAAEGSVSSGKSVADLENDPNFITVRIEDDDSIWVEDTQVFNDQELSLRLRAAKREASGPRSLLVIGDADASHGSAVRVFDAGAGAGVNGISLIVQEKSEASR